MYCPQCSQQQASDDLRFCPRCGFQLKIVAELLSNNGVLVKPEAKRNVSLLHRNEVRCGAKLLFFSAVLVPLAFLLSVIFDSPYPFVVPFITFLIGLTQVLYQLLFRGHTLPEIPEPQHTVLSGVKRRFNLPVSQSVPVPTNDFKRSDTAEVIEPSSVTEHTTKLLNSN